MWFEITKAEKNCILLVLKMPSIDGQFLFSGIILKEGSQNIFSCMYTCRPKNKTIETKNISIGIKIHTGSHQASLKK